MRRCPPLRLFGLSDLGEAKAGCLSLRLPGVERLRIEISAVGVLSTGFELRLTLDGLRSVVDSMPIMPVIPQVLGCVPDPLVKTVCLQTWAGRLEQCLTCLLLIQDSNEALRVRAHATPWPRLATRLEPVSVLSWVGALCYLFDQRVQPKQLRVRRIAHGGRERTLASVISLRTSPRTPIHRRKYGGIVTQQPKELCDLLLGKFHIHRIHADKLGTPLLNSSRPANEVAAAEPHRLLRRPWGS